MQPPSPPARPRFCGLPKYGLLKYGLLEFALLLAAGALVAQLLAPSAIAWWLRPRPEYQGEFPAAGDSRLADGTLPYRMLLFLPAGYSASGPAQPLVVHLHGAGERGTDLAIVRGQSLPRQIDKGLHPPAVVASPQCPPDHIWDAPKVLAVIDYLQRQFNIDPRRISLTGYSMGGSATWRTAALNPRRFAAIVPICGGGETAWAAQLAGMPIWAFHGQRDQTVPVSESITMVDAIRGAGGTPQLTVYPEGQHNVWDDVYQNTELLAWLWSQQLPATAAAHAPAKP